MCQRHDSPAIASHCFLPHGCLEAHPDNVADQLRYPVITLHLVIWKNLYRESLSSFDRRHPAGGEALYDVNELESRYAKGRPCPLRGYSDLLIAPAILVAIITHRQLPNFLRQTHDASACARPSGRPLQRILATKLGLALLASNAPHGGGEPPKTCASRTTQKLRLCDSAVNT